MFSTVLSSWQQWEEMSLLSGLTGSLRPQAASGVATGRVFAAVTLLPALFWSQWVPAWGGITWRVLASSADLGEFTLFLVLPVSWGFQFPDISRYHVALDKITSGIWWLKKDWEVHAAATATYLQHHLCSFCYFRNAAHSWLSLLLVHCSPKTISFSFRHCRLQQNPLSSWLTSGLYFHLKAAAKDFGA